MKLLVLGASGGCGKWIAKLAVERGHKVRALVRKETHFDASEEVQVIHGSVLDRNVLSDAVEGCDAVLSALGIKRKTPLNPWSNLASPENLTADVAKLLVKLMLEFKVDRFVGMSAGGVRESIIAVHPIIRWMISNSNMSASYKDLAKMESTFEKTALDWLAVRPVTLKKGAPTGSAYLTDYYGLTDSISRGEVAEWMLDKVEQPVPFSNRTPMIKSA
jgi:putative NADH-flavin reductase